MGVGVGIDGFIPRDQSTADVESPNRCEPMRVSTNYHGLSRRSLFSEARKHGHPVTDPVLYSTIVRKVHTAHFFGRGNFDMPQLHYSTEKRTLGAIPVDQWKRLYRLADTLQELEPWTFLDEVDILGIQDEKTGWTIYTCTMGGMGTYLGVHFYLETEGLVGLIATLKEESPREEYKPFFLNQNCLALSFEDRQHIDPPERTLIKRMKMKFTGEFSCPRFRRLETNFLPWIITPSEAGFLERILPVYLLMAEQFRDGTLALPDDNRWLIRVRKKDGSTVDRLTDPHELPEPRSPLPDNEALSGFDQEKFLLLAEQLPVHETTWEIDWFLLENAVQESRNARPYFPFGIVILDRKSGLVLNIKVSPTFHQALQELILNFPNHIRNGGCKPAEIATTCDHIQYMLTKYLAGSGIRISRQTELPLFRDIATHMVNSVGDPTS